MMKPVSGLPLFAAGFLVLIAALPAQSPNTASILVVVEDQNGGLVNDAKVSVTNSATGATREATSGSDGSATFAALSLTGTYDSRAFPRRASAAKT